MIKELGELNEKFYELYGRLYENGELLTVKQSEYMAEKLLAQYKAEYERLQLKADIGEMKELYETKQRRGELIPRRWRWFLFWRRTNKAANTIDREIQAEITRYFNEREKALARLEEALERETAAEANEIPDEPDEEPETLDDEATPEEADKPDEATDTL